MKYIAFDLEITKELPEGADDWKAHRPLGISCAATMDDEGDIRVWHGNYKPKMSPAEVGRLLHYLESSGKPIVTWNGLGFDFDVLAEEAWFDGAKERARTLALNHIDIAFQMFCEKGFMCGLNAAAEGMNLAGKTEGMSGALAPVMWKQGQKAQDKVLEYVAQDARTTAEVYEAILHNGFLQWVTKAGRIGTYIPTFKDGRLLTCLEALELELPDTSWMDNPWPREKFTGWAIKEVREGGDTVNDFERLATFEELDREAAGRESAEHADEVAEHGEFGEDGGTLSDRDYADAQANL